MPQPTIREQIIKAVLTALAGINGQPPYQTTVDNVYPYSISSDDVTSDNVAIGVFPRTFQIQRNQTRLTHGADCPATLIVGVRGILKAQAEGIENTHAQFIADVERAIFKNLDFAIMRNAVRIESLAFDSEQILKTGAAAMAGWQASITVMWLTDPRDP